MTLGYGAPEIVARTAPAACAIRALRERNMDNFRKALLTEVIPQVEKSYRASQRSRHRGRSPGCRWAARSRCTPA